MSSIAKAILGAVLRHWLTGFLGVLVTRHYLTDAQYLSLVDSVAKQLNDDFVFTLATSATAAIAPAAIAVWYRLRAKLTERLALLSPALTSSSEVKGMIADAPLSTRIAATVTADPIKILDAPPKAK